MAAARPMATHYLECRVLNDRHGAPFLRRIRDVAARLCQESEDGRDERDYVRLLCPLVMEGRWTNLTGFWASKSVVSPLNRIASDGDLESDVNVAALYTQTLPVVERWVASEKPMDICRPIFGDARYHAARYGSHEILAAMMASCDDSAIQDLRKKLLRWVALLGRVEATRFVLNFQATERSWVSARKNRRGPVGHQTRVGVRGPVGHQTRVGARGPVGHQTRVGARGPVGHQTRVGARGMHTPSKEILDLIAEKRKLRCLEETYGVEEYTRLLRYCAEKGWVEMAAHYISLGASVNGVRPLRPIRNRVPLIAACIHGHEEIVKLLLTHGVDTSPPALETAALHGHYGIVSLLLEYGAGMGEALAKAVRKGYLSIVRTLLEHDTGIEPEWQGLLVSSVQVEDEALFWLLVKHVGGAIDDDTRTECAKVAKEMGLESMLELVSTVQAL
jgi:hypothetical protein